MVELTVLIITTFDDDQADPIPHVRRSLASLGVAYDMVSVRGDGDAYGDALREGFARATGHYILTVDADVDDPSVIARLWAAREGHGVVVASRYVEGGRASMPWYRRAASRALNAIYRRGLSMRVRDLSSAYRLYRRDAVAPLTLTGRHYDVLEEILVGVNADGWQIAEVPFHYVAGNHDRDLSRPLSLAWAFARTFGSMWVLRNSPFSADYDERAYNSVIPLQRYWQRTRVRIISEMLARRGGPVLDIGCGSSRIIINLPNTIGLDIQLKKLRRIQRHILRLVQGTLTTLPFASESFEQVVCSQVIEHIPVHLVDFAEFARVLRHGGTLILGTPDYGTWTWPFLEQLYDIVHPRGYVKEHINHYTAASLRMELERFGFGVEELRYVGGGEMIYRAIKK